MDGNALLLFFPLWPMLCAPLAYGIVKKNKNAGIRFSLAVCAADLAVLVLCLLSGRTGVGASLRVDHVCGLGIGLCVDGFRGLYAVIACFMWTMTTLFSEEYFSHYERCGRYFLFLLLTFGGTVGVFLSADLFTLFLFFEIMSTASYGMVAQDESPGAMRAGDTYLCVAILGGMVMLMGVFLLLAAAGTLEIAALPAACAGKGLLYPAAFLLLFGFGAKAGMFPLHIWLPRAHPVAPAPASALLSGILTKTGVFGILIVTAYVLPGDRFWGGCILAVAVVTMVLGAALAVFSVDIKRTLACSSMSQIGFILIGVSMQSLLGRHNALAVRGTILHMVNHSLLKLVLFMAAGVIYMDLHTLDLNEIRGFGRGKPVLHAAFLMGYLGIAGVPLWNGYVSKTLLHESIVEYIALLQSAGEGTALMKAVEWIFLISGGLTAAYMTKLYVCVFRDPRPAGAPGGKEPYLSRGSALALLLPAALLPVLGTLPGLTMDRIADAGQGFLFGEAPAHPVRYFAWGNLRGGLVSLAIGALVYLLVIRRLLTEKTAEGETVYRDLWPKKLDLEELLYRPLVLTVLPAVGRGAARALGSVVDAVIYLGGRRVPADSSPSYSFREFAFMRERDTVTSITRQILNSFSFSLLLFSGGLCLVLIYILYGFW